MFTKLKNLFKNSKRNQIKKLSLIVEELRAENDARAQEIWTLKKQVQECQDNQASSNDYDVEELQSKCCDMQDTLDNMPDFEDLESRISDLEEKCEDVDYYFNPNEKAEQSDLEELEEKIDDIGYCLGELEEKNEQRFKDIETQLFIDEKVEKLRQAKAELKTMFENIVKALGE